MSEKMKQTTPVPPGIAGLLTYFFPFFGGLVFLVVERENQLVRFHAVQSILLWIVFVVVGTIFSWITVFRYLYYLCVLVIWIFMMYKALMEEMFELPFIGAFAKKQVGIAVEKEPPAGGESDTGEDKPE